MPFTDIFGQFSTQTGSAVPSAEYAVDARFIASARRMIDRAIPKPNATWYSITNDTVTDPNEPWNTIPASWQSYPVRIVFYQESLQGREFLDYRRDTIANEGATMGLFYKTVFTPRLKDIVKVWNRELIIKSINEVRPIKDTIIYIVRFGL